MATQQQQHPAVQALIDRLAKAGLELDLEFAGNLQLISAYFLRKGWGDVRLSTTDLTPERLWEAVNHFKNDLRWVKAPKQKVDLGQTDSWGQDPRKDPNAGEAGKALKENVQSNTQAIIRRKIDVEISGYVAVRNGKVNHAATENAHNELRQLAASIPNAEQAFEAVR